MMLRTSSRFRTRFAGAAGALLFITTQAPTLTAQTSAPTPADRASVETLLADQLASYAIVMVGANQQMNEDHLAGSRILLDLALDLAPQDAELWRLRREQAAQMLDREAERRALREYCRLRPDDDVAQAELILMVLADQQTLQDRVATVERLLSTDVGKNLTPALRSRLASYIALAAREMGNNALFHSWLKYALRTDPTNVVAARLTYDLVIERAAPPLDIAVALHGLLRANPMNPATHQRLGELLLTYGVYDQAAAQFEVTQGLAEDPGNANFYHSWALALAASGQASQALQIIRAYETAITQQNQVQQPETAPQTPATDTDGAAPTPADEDSAALAHLPAEMQMLRLCILGELQTSATAPLDRIRQTIEQEIQEGNPLAKAKLAWLLVWFNHDPQAAAALLEELAAQRSENDLTVRRLRGWMALHAGDRLAAREMLESIADQDAFAAYGMARLLADEQPAQSMQWRRRTVQLEPASLAAMMAAREMAEAGERPELVDVAVGLMQMVRSWKHMIVKPDPVKRPWIALDIKVEPLQPRYFDPIIAHLTLRNMTDMPLSFAPEGPVPTRLFVYISPRMGGRALGMMSPIVVDFNRRLSLAPNETVTIAVPLHRGELGLVLRQLAGQNLTFSATAVLDPRTTPRGRVVNGLMGATATQNLVEAKGIAPSVPQIEQWIAAVDQSDRTARARALANLVQVAPMLASVEDAAETAQKMISCVNNAYASLDPASQAWTLLFMRPSKTEPDPFARVYEVAQRSDAAAGRVAYLLSQVSDPESPQITAAMRHSDPRISAFARVKQHLILEQQAAQAQQPQP